MFDKKRNISGEHPQHIEFIRNVAKPLFESWGYEVLILRAEKDYLDVFNRIIKRPTKHMDHKDKKFGFVTSKRCSVKRDCKMKPIEQYLKSIKDYKQYVGICIDEPQRLKSMHKVPANISLLEKYGYTEDMAMEKCKEYGLVSPCYSLDNKTEEPVKKIFGFKIVNKTRVLVLSKRQVVRTQTNQK